MNAAIKLIMTMPRTSSQIATLPAAAPLTIRRIEAIPVALPLAKPMLMASVRLTHGENLVVRIEAANGLLGWGEASSAPTMTGDTLAGMVGAVEHTLAPLLVGQDALKRAVLVQRCARALRDNRSALAAIDMALLDLLGHYYGMSVSELLGGALRDNMQALWLLGNKTTADDIAEAQQKRRAGCGFFKLKIGVKPIADDIQTALALREALGPDVKLCADANMGLSFDDAREFVTRTKAAGLLFLEQPFGKQELTRTVELAKLSPCALGADEAIGSIQDILDYQRAGAVAGVSLKTIKLGGVAAAVHAATVCDALGLAINLAAKIAESSIAAAGLIHIGAVIADTAWGVSPSNHYLAADLVKTPIRPEGGMFTLPRGHGLGVEADEAEIRRYRV